MANVIADVYPEGNLGIDKISGLYLKYSNKTMKE